MVYAQPEEGYEPPPCGGAIFHIKRDAYRPLWAALFCGVGGWD